MEKKKTILLVDDEENILIAIKRIFFDRNDIVVLTAMDGEEGLTILENNKVDIVISDQKMPVMSGTEFLTKVKERYPDILRIFLTGFTDIHSAIDAINEGEIFRYIKKPWNNDDFKAIMRSSFEYIDMRDKNKEMNELINSHNTELIKLNNSLEEKVKKRTDQLELALEKLEE